MKGNQCSRTTSLIVGQPSNLKDLSSSLRRETSYWFAHCYRGQFLIIIRPLWKVKAFKSCEGFHHCNLASICSMATQADCFNFSIVFFSEDSISFTPFNMSVLVFLDMQPHIVFQKAKLKHSTLFWCTIQQEILSLRKMRCDTHHCIVRYSHKLACCDLNIGCFRTWPSFLNKFWIKVRVAKNTFSWWLISGTEYIRQTFPDITQIFLAERFSVYVHLGFG